MEAIAKAVTMYLSHAVEIMAALIIGIALLKLLFSFIRSIRANTVSKEALRVQFGSSVAVALELLLGADVLATAVAPAWNDIGKLAAIAVLRTALNYFLEKELSHLHTKTIILPEAEQKRA